MRSEQQTVFLENLFKINKKIGPTMSSTMSVIIFILLTIIQNVCSHTYAVHDHPSHPYFREETDSEKKARMRRLNTFIPYVINIFFSQIQRSFNKHSYYTFISPLSITLLTHTHAHERTGSRLDTPIRRSLRP